MRESEEWIVHDGPEDRCFGCGQRNEDGLRLRFREIGEGQVEAEYTAPTKYDGAPGIVHGGIQATLLDEVLGLAIDRVTDVPRMDVVTADFKLRYRRPVPSGVPLRIRGRTVATEGRSFFVEGEILDAAGEVLTRAEARWVRLDLLRD
ncbi:MAG: PaaI family thioesterase [Myxococcota bacterium]|nr:PaaI family thioesterase [Myxococcota bacterium]